MTATEKLRNNVKKNAGLTANDWWDDMSDGAKSSIEQGLKDAEEGKLTPHKEVMKKYQDSKKLKF